MKRRDQEISDNGKTIIFNDGTSIKEIEITRDSAKSSFERFLAHSLDLCGIKEIAGYKTKREIGSGKSFDSNGNMAGVARFFGRGFEKKR